MMKQYRSIKQDQQDAILFFRLGDFYEMFFDDAVEASQLLNLVLTARHGVPMCGIPYHAAKTYIRRLIDAGKKVAICEQTELPKKGKGIVNREVTQVITPGTRIDEDFLDDAKANFICSIAVSDIHITCAFADISTGDFRLIETQLDTSFDYLKSIIKKIQPTEFLVQESYYFENKNFRGLLEQSGVLVNKYPDWLFSVSDAHKKFLSHFNSVSLKQFGINSDDSRLAPAGVLFDYYKQNAKGSLAQIKKLISIDDSSFVMIDESAQRNLELLKNLQDGSEKYTLFSVIRQTKTAVGTRQLRDWIVNPLNSVKEIQVRQGLVTHFYTHQILLNDTRESFKQILDLQRLSTRILMGKSNPRDLLAVSQSVSAFFSLIEAHPELDEMFFSIADDLLIGEVKKIVEHIDQAINSEIKGSFEEGRVINDGHSEELDQLRSIKNDSKDVLNAYLDSIKVETGITNIRLKSNKIIGYFIEVSKSQTHLVPESFLRKQTLVQGERYTTDELIELERTIYKAQSRSGELEQVLYQEIIDQVIAAIDELNMIADCIADIDCYQSLAYCAMKYGYSKPEIVYSNVLEITGGRHPIVESIMSPGDFIPNSLSIEEYAKRSALITGPNMSGKSTFLRQTALIVLMAHMGSYVPADRAVIGITDAIFCRVGASDNLARGESTFLIEMNETAFILRKATETSLVIMDEVGRGTSTRDGLSIAFAVMHKLLYLRSKTLFATHYHELNSLEHEMLQKLYLDISDEHGEIVFLKKVKTGVVSSSYGLHVAELAGIPADVLQMARAHQHSQKQNTHQPELFIESYNTKADDYKVSHLKEIEKLLKRADPDAMTPRDAAQFLYELKDMIESD